MSRAEGILGPSPEVTTNVYTDTKFRRETAGYKLAFSMSLIPGPGAMMPSMDGTPIYYEEVAGGGDQVKIGTLVATLPKNLDGYNFVGMITEVSYPTEGTFLVTPDIRWIKKGVIQQIGEEAYATVTTDVVNIGFSSGPLEDMFVTYIGKTGEVIAFDADSPGGGFLPYCVSRGIIVPIEPEEGYVSETPPLLPFDPSPVPGEDDVPSPVE